MSVKQIVRQCVPVVCEFLETWRLRDCVMSDKNFHVRWDSAALASLRARIQSFEWPREIADSGWRYGL
jgi:hypothetical protein